MTAVDSPLVGVVMGSDSDWPTMQAAAAVLDDFGVPYEAKVVSAHRTPDAMFEYAETAAARGLRAIIASASGAAHLPGMLAAKTIVPVLGVPGDLLLRRRLAAPDDDQRGEGEDRQAEQQHLQALVAGAGRAYHLGGHGAAISVWLPVLE